MPSRGVAAGRHVHRELNAKKDGIDGTPDFAEEWTLDATGNWSGLVRKTSGTTTCDESREHSEVNEITDISRQVGSTPVTPVYDRAGNMTGIPSHTLSYNKTGTYDAWNRLVKVETGVNTPAEYEYDGRNFSTVKRVYDNGQLQETRHYYYNHGWQCLEERLESGGEISSYADRQFVWGLRYIDDLVLRDRDTDANGTLDERLYVLQDPNWNVVALAETDGDVAERYTYSEAKPWNHSTNGSSRCSS